MRALYDEFLPLNAAIKRVMTAWQVKQVSISTLPLERVCRSMPHLGHFMKWSALSSSFRWRSVSSASRAG